MFYFNHPEILWLLLLIPPLAFLEGEKGYGHGSTLLHGPDRQGLSRGA